MSLFSFLRNIFKQGDGGVHNDHHESLSDEDKVVEDYIEDFNFKKIGYIQFLSNKISFKAQLLFIIGKENPSSNFFSANSFFFSK